MLVISSVTGYMFIKWLVLGTQEFARFRSQNHHSVSNFERGKVDEGNLTSTLLWKSE